MRPGGTARQKTKEERKNFLKDRKTETPAQSVSHGKYDCMQQRTMLYMVRKSGQMAQNNASKK